MTEPQKEVIFIQNKRHGKSSDPDKMRENDQNGETDLKTCKLGGQKRTKKAVSSVFKCSRGCLQEERCIRLHIWNYGVRTKTVGGRL